MNHKMFPSKFHLKFFEINASHEFKEKVCKPYFTDIFKDLQGRTEIKNKGINKFWFANYC